MSEIRFRLFGRFVVVEKAIEGSGRFDWSVVMPDMTFGQSGLREHFPSMSLPRHVLAHRHTTFEPSRRIITGGASKEAEMFVWDLAGWTVDCGLSGGVDLTVPPDRELVDLAALEMIQNRVANVKANLAPTPGSIVSTAVLIGGGDARGSVEVETPLCEFVPFNDVNSPKRTPHLQIDVIDVVAMVPELYSLTFANSRGEHRVVAIDASATPTVGLSNLCNQLPRKLDVDTEFAQYYHLLDTVAPDRLVPRAVRHGGDQDCNRQARIKV